MKIELTEDELHVLMLALDDYETALLTEEDLTDEAWMSVSLKEIEHLRGKLINV